MTLVSHHIEQDQWEPPFDLSQLEQNEQLFACEMLQQETMLLQETTMMLAVLRIWSLKSSKRTISQYRRTTCISLSPSHSMGKSRST